MDILNVYSIAGLYYELYSPNPDQFNIDPLNTETENPLRRINALFWAKLFSSQNIDLLLSNMLSSSRNNAISDIERAVLADQQLFKETIIQAPINIINQANSERDIYAYMEQIEIACRLFSKYLFFPFKLSIQDGFEEPFLSSKELINSLKDEYKNPYLLFLKENVFPLLNDLNPVFVWINGQPRQSSLSIVAYLKQLNPNIYVAIRHHSSEYFSLNKIDDLLINNRSLFSLIDCIVLDDNQDTCHELEQIIVNGNKPIHECRNIIYINREKQIISRSASQQVFYTMQECANFRSDLEYKDVKGYISPSQIMNLKMNPNTACYWNKCTFCAINKKYKYITNKEKLSISARIDYIERCISMGIRYFWFEDEAVPPHILDEFADAVLQRGLTLIWQVRARIDLGFTKDLAIKLYKAGLREIRFGLESASMRILNLMNKFPEGITLDTVESIVSICSSVGIHVHFPMIVGFPTETVEERIATYIYLKKLRDKYKMVSFNINILMLDVASDLFSHFAKYNISALYFPCSPDEFLGNMVDYNCFVDSESKESIDIKRNEFMRELLYPWMPIASHIKPNIYYRLTETIRNTLIWKDLTENKVAKGKDEELVYCKSPSIVAWRESKDSYKVYDWYTHHFYIFPDTDYALLCNASGIRHQHICGSEFYSKLIECRLLIPFNL